MNRVIKWLRPGLRVKRWILVIFLGILFAVLAFFSLVYWIFYEGNRIPGLPEYGTISIAAVLVGFTLSAFCLITGIYRLIKSMWSMMDRRGDDRTFLDVAYRRAVLRRGAKVVAIGGGTGLSTVLAGLREQGAYTTAIVSMADDGGSSGKLRKELGLQPPGDLRKCLIALADEEAMMAELLDYRFPEHELGGHNFGNLFLTVLARMRGDFGMAVREANRILSVQGQVLPSTLEKVHLVATHEDGSKTTGQAQIAASEKRIKRLELKPIPESVEPDLLKAIEEAELIILGPGSLYTSVLPNLLIEGLSVALAKTKAKKVFVANIMTYEGETRGYNLPDFLNAINEHTKPYRVYNYVLVNSGGFDKSAVEEIGGSGTEPEQKSYVVDNRVARLVQYNLKDYADESFEVITRDVVNRSYPIRHDTKKLADALMNLLRESRSG